MSGEKEVAAKKDESWELLYLSRNSQNQTKKLTVFCLKSCVCKGTPLKTLLFRVHRCCCLKRWPHERNTTFSVASKMNGKPASLDFLHQRRGRRLFGFAPAAIPWSLLLFLEVGEEASLEWFSVPLMEKGKGKSLRGKFLTRRRPKKGKLFYSFPSYLYAANFISSIFYLPPSRGDRCSREIGHRKSLKGEAIENVQGSPNIFSREALLSCYSSVPSCFPRRNKAAYVSLFHLFNVPNLTNLSLFLPLPSQGNWCSPRLASLRLWCTGETWTCVKFPNGTLCFAGIKFEWEKTGESQTVWTWRPLDLLRCRREGRRTAAVRIGRRNFRSLFADEDPGV